MSVLKRFFGEFDVFSAPPLLRARKQPETSSYTSGILSLIMALLFTCVFASGVYNVITYSQINSVQTDTKLQGQEVKADDLYFAVRVGYLSLQDSLANFDIVIQATTENGTRITIPLQPCKPDRWALIGERYRQKFYQYSLQDFFCPADTTNLSIKKVYYAPQSTHLNIIIKMCTQNPKCNNLTSQKQFVKKLQDQEGAIFMLVYFLDNLLSPNNRQPLNMTINTDIQLAFTTKRGIIGTIQIGTFQIDTDVGYFPVAQTQVLKGNFVNNFRETSYEIVNQTQNYALVYIQMNRRFIYIERKVGKFDEMLSYAGGLFAIIAGFLRFFMFSYNEYRYELMVAEGVCSNDDNGNIIHEDQLTLCKYVKYTIFDWIKTLFCHQIDWKDCKLIDQARQQASSHLDVTNLFRKINSLEVALQHLLQENEKQCLTLMKPQSLNKTRRDRLVVQYYSKIMNGQPATTIQQYKTAQTLLKFSLKIYQKSIKTTKFINVDQIQNDSEPMPQPKPFSVDEFLKLFPDMIHTTSAIQLYPDMDQIENQLSQAFYNLSPTARQKIEKHIPIKILVRLSIKHDKIFRNNGSQFSAKQISSINF